MSEMVLLLERVYTERRWATASKNGVEEDSEVVLVVSDNVEGDEMMGRRIRPRMRATSVGRRADKRGIVNVGLFARSMESPEL